MTNIRLRCCLPQRCSARGENQDPKATFKRVSQRSLRSRVSNAKGREIECELAQEHFSGARWITRKSFCFRIQSRIKTLNPEVNPGIYAEADSLKAFFRSDSLSYSWRTRVKQTSIALEAWGGGTSVVVGADDAFELGRIVFGNHFFRKRFPLIAIGGSGT